MLLRRPGFTLIETLIYTAFVGMIMTTMVLLASTAFTVRSKLRASIVLEQNVRFAVTRITTVISEASGITTPALGTSSSTLVLTTSATSTNPTTIRNTGGIITITQGATGTALTLNSNEVSFSNLSFTRVSSTAAMVRIVASGGLRNAAASYATITVTTTAAVRR